MNKHLGVAWLLLCCACSFELHEPPACPWRPNSCEGTEFTYCAPDGTISRIDCAAQGLACNPALGSCDPWTDTVQDQLGHCAGTLRFILNDEGEKDVFDCAFLGVGFGCARDDKGVAYCSEPVPDDLTYLGRCEGSTIVQRNGDVVARYDCATDANGPACGRLGNGYATCTPEVDPVSYDLGSCDGNRISYHSAEVSLAFDCDNACATTWDGYAQCSAPNDPTATAFGQCRGDTLVARNGSAIERRDCGAIGAECTQISAWARGCRGCGSVPLQGACVEQNTAVQQCSLAGKITNRYCPDGCEFDAEQCSWQCNRAASADAACPDGHASGDSWCALGRDGRPVVGRCTADEVAFEYCPSADDGTIDCVEQQGAAKCVSTCPRASYCTDLGVMVSCLDGELSDAIDCHAVGSGCVEDAAKETATCTCEAIPAEAKRCVGGQRFVCADGLVTREACECDPH